MTIRRLAARAAGAATALTLALLVVACGGGSGRYVGTDLVVTGVGPSSQLNGGDAAVFVMTITNEGDYDATDLAIKNVTSQISQPTLHITCESSGGATCPDSTGSSMSVSSLPVGGALVFTVSGTLNVGASGTVSDTMSVNADSEETNAEDNSLTVNATTASNDVTVTATAPAGPLLEGAATYTFVVGNAGPDVAENVVLSAEASSDLTLVPADITCAATAGASPAKLQSDGTLQVASIPLDGVLTCSVPVTVLPATNGFAIVTLTASGIGDSRTANNSGSASVSATLINDLNVTATAPEGPLVSPSTTFTFVISNLGPATAPDVVITNILGANLTLNGAIACKASGGAVAPMLQADGTLLSPSIPLNGVLTCSVPVTVAAGNTGTVIDTLSVSNCCDTLHTANNSANALVSTTLSNNVTVTAKTGPASVPGGGSTVFSFVVDNAGPSTAFNVGLTNALSPNLTLTGQVTCTASGAAVVPVAVSGVLTSAAIPAGDSLTCSVPVTVTAGANGTVSSKFTASAANDVQANDNSGLAATLAVSSDLGVSQSVSPQGEVAAGSDVTFTAAVVNPRGQGTASDLTVKWSHSQPAGTKFTISCIATGNASCPSVLGTTMTVPSLVAGGQLQFAFTASTASTDRGAIKSTVSVSAGGDANTANNSATTSVDATDGRNGSYQVYAADGQPGYSLALAFDDDPSTGHYTLTAAGKSTQYPFKLDTGTGDYVLTGNDKLRFRTVQDTVVGAHDFGHGALPYVAARNFASTIPSIAGTYDLATRNLPADGSAPLSHAGTAVVSGNTLSVCQSDTPARVLPVVSCNVDDRKDYALTVSNGTFTATRTTGSDSYSFKVAIVGATKALLSAGDAADGSKQFRIGVPDSIAGVIGADLRGPSTDGDFLSITLTSSSYATPVSTAQLTRVGLSAAGPISMLYGPRSHDAGTLYVMEAAPLAIVVGGIATAASGYLQIGVP